MPAKKIELKDGKSLGFQRDFVSFACKHPKFPRFFDRAIIDTGCPFIIISEDAVKRLRIPYRNFPIIHPIPDDPSKPLVLGNMIYELRDMGECTILMRNTDDEMMEFKHPVYVGIPQLPVLQKIPSFIGIEFLRKHKLSVINGEKCSYLALLDSC